MFQALDAEWILKKAIYRAFIYLFERAKVSVREKTEGGREISNLLVYLPKVCKSQNWARLTLGARNTILVFLLGGRGPSTWAFFLCLPRSMGREPDHV